MTILNRWLSFRPWRMYRSYSYFELKILNSKILNYQSTDYTTILLHDYTKNRQQKTDNRLHHYTTLRLLDYTKNAQPKTMNNQPTLPGHTCRNSRFQDHLIYKTHHNSAKYLIKRTITVRIKVSLNKLLIMDSLFEYSNQLISKVDTSFNRYSYDQIDWGNRLVGLIGPRGVGKTTLVLQYIKNNLNVQQTLYVTAEDFFFAKNRLIDLADDFVKSGGQYLFIDEIHKYPNWSKELKLIYDYHQELMVVFTGSSVLDIKKGSSDLSRRAVIYNMQGLSFREYLQLFHEIQVPKFTLEDIMNHQVTLPKIRHPLPLFADYLKRGYYPFAKENDFDLKLRQVINQTLESDIPTYAEMNVSTGRKLKQLLAIVAESAPFKPNMSKIAEMLKISRNNIADYLLYMEEAGMLSQLRSSTKGIRQLGKVDKVYLDNTNLISSLADDSQNKGNIRETFYLNQLRVNHKVTSSELGDFKIDDTHFEVGGKNKTSKQIKTAEKGFIVKDDIETGFLNTIPLWHFGLMY